jgi:hypothetical protein
MRMTSVATLLIAAFWVATDAAATGCAGLQRVSSGSSRVGIAELYTSEGCDSCPPADKWLSGLSASKDGVVPLAFHVDYWDYIGWKDRFANAAFSERQREAVRRQGGKVSYTPQVMVNGRDQRFWADQSRFASSVMSIAAHAPRANIDMQFTSVGAGLDVTLTTSVPQIADRADASVFLAITESKLSSRVLAGENRGATLRHDHVVRALLGPVSPGAGAGGDKLVVARSIALDREWKRDDLSLVAFVQSLRTGEVYQAISTPLCAGM